MTAPVRQTAKALVMPMKLSNTANRLAFQEYQVSSLAIAPITWVMPRNLLKAKIKHDKAPGKAL